MLGDMLPCAPPYALPCVLSLTLLGCAADPDAATDPDATKTTVGTSGDLDADGSSGAAEEDGEGSSSSGREDEVLVDCASVSIAEVSLFQVLETPLWDGSAVPLEARSVPVVAGRAARVRTRVDGPSADAVLRVEVGALSLDATSTPDGFHVDVPGDAIDGQAEIAVQIVGCPDSRTASIALGAVETGPIALHLVPFEVGGYVPDTSQTVIDGLRDAVFAIYPVTEVTITVGDVVPDASGGQLDMGDLLIELGVIQEQEDEIAPNVYYYGLVTGAASREEFCETCPTGTSESGNGDRAAFAIGAAFADQRSEDTLIHELGHMHGLLHAPCGDPDQLDQEFPYEDASTTVEGWDVRTDTFIAPGAQDMMAYCYPRWISDYNYEKLVDWVQLAQTWR